MGLKFSFIFISNYAPGIFVTLFQKKKIKKKILAHFVYIKHGIDRCYRIFNVVVINIA